MNLRRIGVSLVILATLTACEPSLATSAIPAALTSATPAPSSSVPSIKEKPAPDAVEYLMPSGPVTVATSAQQVEVSEESDEVYPLSALSVVHAFLATLKDDPTGSASVKYLSRDLRMAVAKGRPVAVLLGTQSPGVPFTIDDSSTTTDRHTAVVSATLDYADIGQDAKAFTLVLQDGGWRIIDIRTIDSIDTPIQ